jgi:hypothetical protein
MNPSQTATQLEHLGKEQLPLALTNVASFTHDGKACSTEKPCEATMWSFDLAYPTSSCTPEVMGWVQPCVAKLLPDGTLVLLRGAHVQSGINVVRPPLMGTMNHASEALSFANGVAAATQSSFEVLLLHKHRSISSGFSDVFVGAPQLRSDSTADDVNSIAKVRQLQSSTNSSDDDNETATTTTTTTTTSTAAVNTTTNTSNTTANLSELNNTVSAEIGQAHDLRLWSTSFLCLTLRFLIH